MTTTRTASRSSSLKQIDISKYHGTSIIPGRESHTADLVEYDKYVKQLESIDRTSSISSSSSCSSSIHNQQPSRGGERDETPSSLSSSSSSSFEPKLWAFLRSVLEKAAPVGGLDELPSPDETIALGKEDNDRFIEKFKTLGMVNPIYPAAVAAASGIDVDAVLVELLYAARKTSLLSLVFAPECVRCGAAASLQEKLAALPSATACVACGFGNRIESLDKIKVLFLFNNQVLYVPEDNLGCPPVPAAVANTLIFAPVPATSTGSGFSYTTGFDRGGKKMVCPALAPGRYRMRCPISCTDGFLEVQKEATNDSEPIVLKCKVSEMVVRDSLDKKDWKTIQVPHGKIQFDAFPDTRSFSMLWIQKDQDEDKMLRLPDQERTKYTTAAEAIHHPAFQLLFRDQVVNDGGTLTPHGASLSLERVVLVFTDIVNSTALYRTIGDGPALQMVRKHYEILFDAFWRQGRVVKTIGDSVLAAFSSSRAALQAVVTALRNIDEKDISHPGFPSRLQIRVGVHAGPCMVVPLNGMNDYFGSTVNMAARLESAARPGECLLSEAMLGEDSDCKSALEEILEQNDVVSSGTKGTSLDLKGFEEPVRVRGFRVQNKKRKSM